MRQQEKHFTWVTGHTGKGKRKRKKKAGGFSSDYKNFSKRTHWGRKVTLDHVLKSYVARA